MIHFHHFPVEDLTGKEALLLVKAARFGYCGESATSVVREGLAKKNEFFRVTGLVSGLLVVKFKNHADGRTLWIECLAGKGLVDHVQEMKAALKALAKINDCATFSGLVFRKGMKWVVDEAKLPVKGLLFSEKVDA